jgi:hypothetical protein
VPSISGTPATVVAADVQYAFQPRAAGDTLNFSINNKPLWASFDVTTGKLSGTPGSADTGEYPNITISATNGASTATLPAFTIQVTPPGTTVASNATPASSSSSTTTDTSSSGTGSSTPAAGSGSSTSGSGSTLPPATSDSVTLSWSAPSENTNGTALTSLAGYAIHYGTSPSALTQQISINSVGVLNYVVSNLSSGTWYFEVVAINSAGVQSAPSSVVSTTI